MAHLYDGPESATSRALCLPEIVSAIVLRIYDDYLLDDDRTILACTLVASLWATEANRHLWKFCGNGLTESKDRPYVRHLAAIAPERRQKYANYIRILEICNERAADTDDGHGSAPDTDEGVGNAKDIDERDLWEGQFHHQLAQLSFPRLEELELHGPRNDNTSRHDRPPLAQYLQPNLKKISLVIFQEPMNLLASDESLAEMTTRCAGLNNLSVWSYPAVNSVSPRAFTSFLQATVSLVDLKWGTGLDASRAERCTSMSSEALTCLAHRPSLEHLDVQYIQDSWIKDLHIETLSPQSLFTALRSLECAISADGLQILLPLLPDLWRLRVAADPGSIHAFSVIANAGLTKIKDVGFEPCPGATVCAADLLTLVKNAPDLEELVIPVQRVGLDPTLPVFPDLDDVVVEELATFLSKIVRFTLLTSDPTSLTEKSLIALCTHCPALGTCELSATVNWTKLIRETPSCLSSKLSHLSIHGPEEEEEDENGEAQNENALGQGSVRTEELQEMAKGIVKLLPSMDMLETFSNFPLMVAVMDILRSEQTSVIDLLDYNTGHDDTAHDEQAQNEPTGGEPAPDEVPLDDLTLVDERHPDPSNIPDTQEQQGSG